MRGAVAADAVDGRRTTGVAKAMVATMQATQAKLWDDSERVDI